MRKIFSILLFVVASFCVANIDSTAFAEEKQSSTISIGSVTGEINETVNVPISIENNQGIISLVTEISYDNTALKLVSVNKDAEFWKSANMTPGGDLSAQPYRIIWYDGLAKSDFTEDGTLAELSFEILKEGSHEIKLSISDNDTFDSNFSNVPIETCNGKIDVAFESVTTESTSMISTTSTTVTTTTSSNTTTNTTTPVTTADTTTSTFTDTTNETTTVTTSSTIAPSSSTSTSIETTTETTTTEIPKIDVSPYELSNWAENDYYQKTGIEPYTSTYTENADGTLTITLWDNEGNVLDIYTVHSKTGVGFDSNGENVNLPQTGNNSMSNWLMILGTFLLIGVGAIAIKFSGISVHRKDEE